MRGPLGVSSNQLRHDIFFDLFYISRRFTLVLFDVQPRLFKRRFRVPFFVVLSGDEYDFKLSPIEIVPDHDLVTIYLECSTSFGYQERWVGFELVFCSFRHKSRSK